MAAKKSRPRVKDNTLTLVESRWVPLQLETSRENVIHHWIQSCQALTTWEKNGGRTIHWSISTAQHFHLDSIIGGWNLTADPSYPSFHLVGCPLPAGARALVLLYQYNEEDTPMSWFTSPEFMWVAIGGLPESSKAYRLKVTWKSGAATTYPTMSSRCPRRYSGCRSRPARTSVLQHTFSTCPVLNTSHVASLL